MSDVHELLAAAQARTVGTPYVVTETPRGFDVNIDIENASWYALLYKAAPLAHLGLPREGGG